MSAVDPSHVQLLLILAICCLPALFQFILDDFVHWLWVALCVVAAVVAVILW